MIGTLAVRWDRYILASMGPRSHERGNELYARCVGPSADARASMGPRSHERGNTTFCKSSGREQITSRLQWGRVLMNAETHQKFNQAADYAMASMGPRSHERGNVSLAGCGGVQSLDASMGPRSHERGNSSASSAMTRSTRWQRASMGPRSHERGNGQSSYGEPVVGFSGGASMGPRSHERGNTR